MKSPPFHLCFLLQIGYFTVHSSWFELTNFLVLNLPTSKCLSLTTIFFYYFQTVVGFLTMVSKFQSEIDSKMSRNTGSKTALQEKKEKRPQRRYITVGPRICPFFHHLSTYISSIFFPLSPIYHSIFHQLVVTMHKTPYYFHWCFKWLKTIIFLYL